MAKTKGRRRKRKNVDTFTLGLIGPAVEKAAATAAPASRARKKRKKSTAAARRLARARARARRRKNVDVADVLSFWLEYADGQDFSRKAIRAGEAAIKDDPEHWADVGMSKLADHVDAWRLGRGSERNPLGGPVIGNNVLAIEYRGGEGKKKNSLWRHDFSRTGAKVIGLKDGSVLIKRGKKPLWRYFD